MGVGGVGVVKNDFVAKIDSNKRHSFGKEGNTWRKEKEKTNFDKGHEVADNNFPPLKKRSQEFHFAFKSRNGPDEKCPDKIWGH